MPWMPEVFTTPIAAARRAQDEEATSTNDAVPYYEGILADEPDALVSSFGRREQRRSRAANFWWRSSRLCWAPSP